MNYSRDPELIKILNAKKKYSLIYLGENQEDSEVLESDHPLSLIEMTEFVEKKAKPSIKLFDEQDAD